MVPITAPYTLGWEAQLGQLASALGYLAKPI